MWATSHKWQHLGRGLPKQVPAQVPPSLPSQDLCQHVRQVHLTIFFSNSQYPSYCRFSNRMVVIDCIMLFLQSRLALCFFCKVDLGMLAFLTTPRLSQNTFAAPSIGTPNIRNLYRNTTISSLQICNAIIGCTAVQIPYCVIASNVLFAVSSPSGIPPSLRSSCCGHLNIHCTCKESANSISSQTNMQTHNNVPSQNANHSTQTLLVHRRTSRVDSNPAYAPNSPHGFQWV